MCDRLKFGLNKCIATVVSCTKIVCSSITIGTATKIIQGDSLF